jgi:hypothetical protein
VGHFRAVYYKDPQGFEPVRDFVDALPQQIQAAVENQIARLNLPQPPEQGRSGPQALIHALPSPSGVSVFPLNVSLDLTSARNKVCCTDRAVEPGRSAT